MSSQKSKRQAAVKTKLPTIPDKVYFTIGEVAELCDLKAHVLRYWEQEFSQISPTKRRGNRRYYQRKDILVLRRIKTLLYEQGFTIEGARQFLEDEKTSNTRSVQKDEKLQRLLQSIDRTIEELEEAVV